MAGGNGIGKTNYYQVGADGKAPSGLQKGDAVITGGGAYVITGVNADGSYQSTKASNTVNTSNFTGTYSSPGTTGVKNDADPTPKQDDSILDTQKTNGMNDIQPLIDNLTAATKQARIAALDSAFKTATGNLESTYKNNILNLDNTQRGIAGSYQVKKNNAAAQSDVGGYNFAQYMAARGIKGSAGGMPEIYRNMSLQNTLGNLNTAEAQDNANIDTQKASLLSNYNTSLDTMRNNYETDKIAAGAEIDATALDQKIAASKEAAAKAAADTTASKNEWISNIGQFSGDYQAEINRVSNDGDTSNDWQIAYLKSARQAKIDAQAQTDAANAAAADQESFDRWLAIQKLQQSEAKSGSGSGGSGSGTKGLTFSQVSGQMNNLYSNMKNNPTYFDTVTNSLTAEGKKQLISYANTWGTDYNPDQLLAPFGITANDSTSFSPVTLSAGANTIQTGLASALRYGSSSDEIVKSLTSYVNSNRITTDEAKTILKNLGLA